MPTETADHPVTVATCWLDGCSGCHMSLLDIDERLIELASQVRIVYGPLVDAKVVPPGTDLGIIEGAVSNADDLHKAQTMRAACRYLIALGDCAVTGNVPSMRNVFELGACYDRAFRENADTNPGRPADGVPALLPRVLPVHQAVHVDLHVPGCPPPADAIYYVLTELLAGRTPQPLKITRFGR